MAQKTQEQFVKQILREKGQINRNLCLSLFITRLGAIINRLNREGWNITGSYTEDHRDYVYKVVKSPVIRKVEIIDGRPVIRN